MNATVIIVQDVACLVFYFCFIYLGTEHWKNNSSEPAFHIIPKQVLYSIEISSIWCRLRNHIHVHDNEDRNFFQATMFYGFTGTGVIVQECSNLKWSVLLYVRVEHGQHSRQAEDVGFTLGQRLVTLAQRETDVLCLQTCAE